MENSKKKNPTTRFLIGSFIGLLNFSIIMFSLLGIYMGRKSKNAVYEIGKIYMSGMNEQMSRHFETVIKLRFNQVSGIVSVVPTDTDDKDTLYEELIYRAQVREFDYLALCSADGEFQTLYGQPREGPFPGGDPGLGLGAGLLRGIEDRGCEHPPSAHQNRRRPHEPGLYYDRVGIRL